MSRVIGDIEIGEYTFFAVVGHGFPEYDGVALWRFGIDGRKKSGELYASLDHAMVAAVAEKHTGPRGAGGSGVGTAADWFMRMIGVEYVTAIEEVADTVRAETWENDGARHALLSGLRVAVETVRNRA